MTRLVTITNICGGWKDEAGHIHQCGKKLGEYQEEDRGEEYYRVMGKTSNGYCDNCKRQMYKAYGIAV